MNYARRLDRLETTRADAGLVFCVYDCDGNAVTAIGRRFERAPNEPDQDLRERVLQSLAPGTQCVWLSSSDMQL